MQLFCGCNLNLHCIVQCIGYHTCWINGHLSISSPYGLCWALFGFLSHVLDLFVMLQSSKWSTSFSLLGMQCVTLSIYYCLCCYASVCYWLTPSSATTWIWLLLMMMIKFHNFQVGDIKKFAPCNNFRLKSLINSIIVV